MNLRLTNCLVDFSISNDVVEVTCIFIINFLQFHIFLTFWLFNAFFPGNTLLFFLFNILQSQDFFHIMPWEEYQVYLQSNPPKVTCFARKEHLYGGKRKRNFSKIFFTCGGHPTKLMFCSLDNRVFIEGKKRDKKAKKVRHLRSKWHQLC